jgi:hypothetical protein
MFMVTITLISFAVFFFMIFLHYAGLRLIAEGARRFNREKILVPPFLMFGIGVLHMLEIILYALVFYVLHVYTDLGGFTEEFKPVPNDYIYLSGANFTTLGMSNFYPTGHFKVLAVSEALAGFMMLTWSATFFYGAAGQFLSDEEK